VIVSDTGRGIAADFLPHLFERFRQADSRFSLGMEAGLAAEQTLRECLIVLPVKRRSKAPEKNKVINE
jgi:hypothetical protein